MYKTQDTVLKSTTDMTVYTKQTLVTARIVYATKNYRCDSLHCTGMCEVKNFHIIS